MLETMFTFMNQETNVNFLYSEQDQKGLGLGAPPWLNTMPLNHTKSNSSTLASNPTVGKPKISQFPLLGQKKAAIEMQQIFSGSGNLFFSLPYYLEGK